MMKSVTVSKNNLPVIYFRNYFYCSMAVCAHPKIFHHSNRFCRAGVEKTECNCQLLTVN
ncbi:hypothetical protein ACHQM5_030176 [Ranunculus cassubicifolius]